MIYCSNDMCEEISEIMSLLFLSWSTLATIITTLILIMKRIENIKYQIKCGKQEALLFLIFATVIIVCIFMSMILMNQFKQPTITLQAIFILFSSSILLFILSSLILVIIGVVIMCVISVCSIINNNYDDDNDYNNYNDYNSLPDDIPQSNLIDEDSGVINDNQKQFLSSSSETEYSVDIIE